MKHYTFKILIVLFSALLFSACDTPKALTKKGDKYSEKSLHYDACQYYMKALRKKSDFLEAKTGLKSAGQKQINLYLDQFFKAKNFGEDRKAIYHYRDASNLQTTVSGYSVQLDIPSIYTSDYQLLVNNYVENTYEKAMQFLDDENFSESEILLKEISILKPNYKNTDQLKDVATFEPIYRKANENLELEKFRAAYYEFDKIPLSYKSCEERKQLALDAGLLTIGILKFDNASRKKGGESAISALVTDELMKLDNPFIKLVDRQLTQTFIDEQLLGLSGQVSEGSNAQAGELLGAKVVLTGKLVSFSKQHQPLSKSEKKAYLERKVRKYNSETEKYYYETVYDKIKFNEYNGSTSVQLGFQFQLISTETGEILLTKLYNLNQKDEVNFAESNHNYNKIIPGNWRWQNKGHSTDIISQSNTDKRALKQLFRNKKKLMSVDELATKMYKEIALKVSQKINDYNPENE